MNTANDSATSSPDPATARPHTGGEGDRVSERRYLQPTWMQRQVGNRLAPLFRRSLIAKLSVPGRRSGRRQTVPLVILEHGGERYLVSYRGESDWARNLRASGHGRLSRQGHTESIEAVEVPIAERAPLLELYAARYGRMPTVTAVLRALPDAADHPIFRITTADDNRSG
jgi:deazaflavin-dependent oxidoreductase (nitroreductase family)